MTASEREEGFRASFWKHRNRLLDEIHEGKHPEWIESPNSKLCNSIDAKARECAESDMAQAERKPRYDNE
jgi:hypothetical protein